MFLRLSHEHSSKGHDYQHYDVLVVDALTGKVLKKYKLHGIPAKPDDRAAGYVNKAVSRLMKEIEKNYEVVDWSDLNSLWWLKQT